jgi:uncharacterized membrane protein
MLALSAQLLVLGSALSLFGLWDTGQVEWYWALSPIVTLVLLPLCAGGRLPSQESVAGMIRIWATSYRVFASILAFLFVQHYFKTHQVPIFASIGFLFFLSSFRWRGDEPKLLGAFFTVIGIGMFLVEMDYPVKWQNLASPILLLVQQQLSRMREEWRISRGVQVAAILGACAQLFYFFTRWMIGEGHYLSVGWALLALALFTLGLILKERSYRWAGLAILGIALVRVILMARFLKSPQKELSFIVLGAVLLLLSYLYTRYQERIKQWL